MFDVFRVRRAQGLQTSPFPIGGAEFPERYRGRPRLHLRSADADLTPLAEAIPTTLIYRASDGSAALDLGACLFSPEEAVEANGCAVEFTTDHRMALGSRTQPASENELARALTERTKKIFGRSLRLRSVVAGSCNGCEAELNALSNVVFDMARFGVQFVASPRHADGIVITGAINRNMRFALERTLAAVPEPKLVIAVGACAMSGGPFVDSPEVEGGVPETFAVDLRIPGCPPHPLTILDGLLRLLGKLV